MKGKSESIPDYPAFFSKEAIKLVKWSKSEKNRIKSRKIYEVACHHEYKYRKDKTGNTSPEIKRWSGGCITFATPLWIIGLEELWKSGKL